MVSPNEFSHIIKLDEIGAGASTVRLSADLKARNALALRFDLVQLDSLEAEIAVSRGALGVFAEGRFHATLSQHCVATGDPVPAILDELMAIRFVPEPVVGAGAEIELEADDCDTMFLTVKASIWARRWRKAWGWRSTSIRGAPMPGNICGQQG
jgi:hypothetical protein